MSPLDDPLHIHVKEKPTLWYVWRCPFRQCTRKIEATVKRWVELQAVRHIEAHTRRTAKTKAATDAIKAAMRAVESDKSALLIA